MTLSRVGVSAMPASSITITVRGPMPGSWPVVRSVVELGERLGRHPGRLAEDRRGRCRRGQADDGVPEVVVDVGQRAHRGGLPGSGRRERQCHLPGVADHGAHQLVLALVEIGSVELGLHECELDVEGVDGGGRRAAGGVDDAPLGVQHPLTGEVVGAAVAVDAGPVGASQDRGVGDRVEVGRQVDQPGRGRADQVLNDLGDLLGRYVEVAHLALRLGVQVPGLPGRTAFLQLGDDSAGGLFQPLLRELRARRASSGSGPHRSCARRPRCPSSWTASACHVARCSASDRGSCLAARVSRFARCARASDCLAVGGRPCLTVKSAVSSPVRSSMSRRRCDHRSTQHRVDALDLPDRTLTRTSGRVDEPDAEELAEAVFERGVVRLGGGSAVLVQHRAVDREPLALTGLDLVRDRDVGVEVRIAGTRVPVQECRPRSGRGSRPGGRRRCPRA